MEDVVDFFIPKCQVLGITAEMFGICDDDDKAEKTPAYVSLDNEEKWGAIIRNYSGKPLNFTAVDNCVVVRRDNDDMENRCDAMLSNADNLVFVELKNERQKWFPHAVEQLQKTIDVFKQYNDVSIIKGSVPLRVMSGTRILLIVIRNRNKSFTKQMVSDYMTR